MNDQELMGAWGRGRVEGRAFAVGSIGDNPREAANKDGFRNVTDMVPGKAVSCVSGACRRAGRM